MYSWTNDLIIVLLSKTNVLIRLKHKFDHIEHVKAYNFIKLTIKFQIMKTVMYRNLVQMIGYLNNFIIRFNIRTILYSYYSLYMNN